jgi:hypothetical protein
VENAVCLGLIVFESCWKIEEDWVALDIPLISPVWMRQTELDWSDSLGGTAPDTPTGISRQPSDASWLTGTISWGNLYQWQYDRFR